MKKYIGSVLGSLLPLVFCLPTYAAVSKTEVKKKTQPQVAKILNNTGSSYGGLAGSGFTLLDVRRTTDAKKKMERVVFDVGDRDGKPLKGRPGFYYAEYQKKSNRVILDFSQMPSSKVDQARLAKIFKQSKAIKNSRMSMDPVDNALNLSLDLQKNTKVRVYQVPGTKTTSKVVIDFITK